MAIRNMSHIIVGCGGSGAKIALGVAELMSRDPRWRYEMDNSVFFLLIDTDAGDLEIYERQIRGKAPDVYVARLQTSQGFKAPHEIIETFRAGVESGMGHEPVNSLQRFAEHWWVRNPNARSFVDADVFMIPDVRDITTGAGQVPMTSFLAALQSLRDNHGATASAQSVLDGLFKEIANRRAVIGVGNGNPLEHFNVMFTGSVAGGTGRGCVIPIAFKMKEMMHRRLGSVPSICGYLMDESCFRDRREPHEAKPQMLNAMTGWSELSAWISLGSQATRTPSKYRYSLPGATGPHLPENDALDLRALSSIESATPLNTVGIIGGTSGSGFVATPEQLYDMLAASLYVDITESHLKSQSSNSYSKYFSVGSAVIEVPYEPLRRFFDDKARLDAGDRLQRSLGKTRLADETAKVLEFLGLGENALSDLLGVQPGEEPISPMQKFAQDLLAEGGEVATALVDLVRKLEDQDAEAAQEVIDKLGSPSMVDDLARPLAHRYTTVLARHLTDKLKRDVASREAVVETVAGLLIGADEASLIQREGSAQAVGEVCKEVASQFGNLTDSNGAFSKEAIAAWRRANGLTADLGEIFAVARKREGMLGILGKRFSDEEIQQIKSAAQVNLLCTGARALAKGLLFGTPGSKDAGVMIAVAERLRVLGGNAAKVVSAIRELQENGGLKSADLEAQGQELFADVDDLDKSIKAGMGEAAYMLRRRIRPLRPPEDHLRLDCSSLLEVVARQIAQTGNGERGPLQAAKELTNKLNEAKYRHVGRAEVIGAPTGSAEVDIMEAFKLADVVRELADAWPGFLTRKYNESVDGYHVVAQAFSNFFGIEPRKVGEKIQIRTGNPDGKRLVDAAGEDFLLLGMATVAARTCRPFWQTVGQRSETSHLTVQVPIVTDAPERWVAEIKQGANLAVTGGREPVDLIKQYDGGSEYEFNPYVLVVSTRSGALSLDTVSSLTAWRDPDIRRCLKLAERNDPPMPFRFDEMWEGYRGSGFTDPVYVNRDDLRRLRWRPWFDEKSDDAESASQRHQVMMALAYAWVGPEWFLRQMLQAEGSKRAGPLFKFGRRASIQLARRPVVFVEGFDDSRPLESLQFRKAAGFAKMPSEDEEVAVSLDALAARMDPVATAGDDSDAGVSMKALREGIIAEYQSFLEFVADPAGFHPERDRDGFAELIDRFRAYVGERIDGKVTDPEHPSTSKGRHVDSRAEGSDTGRNFWRGVSDALDHVAAMSRGL